MRLKQLLLWQWSLALLMLAACQVSTPSPAPSPTKLVVLAASPTVLAPSLTLAPTHTATLQLPTITPEPSSTPTASPSITPSSTNTATPRPLPTQTPAIVATTPAPTASTGRLAQPVFSELKCCTKENNAPLTNGLALPAQAIIAYEITCPNCGSLNPVTCVLPFFSSVAFGAPATLPGLVVQANNQSSYVQTSEVIWSSQRFNQLCAGKPVQVYVDVRGFPKLNGQTATIFASARFTRSADTPGQVLNPTPAPLWYSSAATYQVIVP